MLDNSFLSVLAFAAVIIGGLGAILGGISVVLHAIAPRTKTTADDRLAVGFDTAHAKLDQVLGLLREILPAGSVLTTPIAPPSASSAPSSTSAAAPMRNPQAGHVTLGVLLVAALPVLLALGIGIGMSACHTLGPAAADGLVAAFDCEAQHFTTQLLIDATHFADGKIDQLLADAAAPSSDAVDADLKPFDTDAKRCALFGLVTGATSAAGSAGAGSGASSSSAVASARASVAPAASSAAGDPARVRAAVSAAARQAGWPPIRVADGTTL